jgi:putative intracellular protease/amidase
MIIAKVLFVLTSHDRVGASDERTGFYFGEVTHPWDALTSAGHIVEFASPQGGAAPRTRVKMDDPMDRAFLATEAAVDAIDDTLQLQDVDPARYDAVHLPGGHGTMWDFAQDPRVGEVTAAVYEAGGVVSAICHGPAGLVNAELSDGAHLVAGKRLTSFTNTEEQAAGKEQIVPYLLETALRERGADYREVRAFEPHIEVDGRLLTGQNPLSSRLLANALVRALSELPTLGEVS